MGGPRPQNLARVFQDARVRRWSACRSRRRVLRRGGQCCQDLPSLASRLPVLEDEGARATPSLAPKYVAVESARLVESVSQKQKSEPLRARPQLARAHRGRW